MASQPLVLRIVVDEGDIRKATTTRPDTLEELNVWIKDFLQANYNFTLQYEDHDFNNALCNLTNLADLPDKATVKIIPVLELQPVPLETERDSISEADTEILSSPGSSCSRTLQWPVEFETPKFSGDVEYRLRQGNLIFFRDGVFLKVTKELKHEILQKLAETMYTFKPYPTNQNFEEVAKALVQTHPCLKERGNASGFAGWVNSLKFKMGNYRTKLRQMGRCDVTINSHRRGRTSTDGEPPHKNIKKARKGELNFLPDFPEGMDEGKLEALRLTLVNEMKKAHPTTVVVKKLMDLTFALRRKEHDKPPIALMVQRWPALFTENQICHEFNRIVGKSLSNSFLEALDQITPNMMEIFKRKTGAIGQKLNRILEEAKTTTPTDNRSLILRGLPVILGDDPGAFFKTASDCTDETPYADTSVGILHMDFRANCPQQALPSSSFHNPPSFAVGIILEGTVVMDDLDNLPQAFYLLFGLIYALHLDYPRYMKNTFSFVQDVLLNIGQEKLGAKVQTLKNHLAM